MSVRIVITGAKRQDSRRSSTWSTETMERPIDNDTKSFAMTTWYPSIDAVEAGRFRFGREVESVRERSGLLKRSGRRTVEEHKNQSRRERRRDPIIAWRYSPYWWKLVHVDFTRKVYSSVVPETVLLIEQPISLKFSSWNPHWIFLFSYHFTICDIKIRILAVFISFIGTYLSLHIQVNLYFCF